MRFLPLQAGFVALFLYSVVPAAPARAQGEALVRRLVLKSDGPLQGISLEDVQRLLVLRPGELYSRSRAKQTIQRLYSTQLFHDVQVDLAPVADGQVDVTLTLLRRYRLGKIEFEGKVELSDRLLRREVVFREGEAYSAVGLEESLARLQELYHRHGYYQAHLSPEFRRDSKRALLGLTFQVQAGPRARVRRLEIDAEGSVDEEKIRSLIQTQVGGFYSQVQMEEDLKTLERFFASQGYLRPDIYLRDGAPYDPQDNTVSVTLRIVPRQRTRLEFRGIQLSQQELMELPLIRERGPSLLFLESTLRELKNRLQSEGYFLAQVESDLNPASDSVPSIVIEVDPGRKYRLSRVVLEGNRFVESRVLMRFLAVEEKGLFSPGKLTQQLVQQDLDRIRSYYQQRGFLDVQVSYEIQVGKKDSARLLYRIEEGPRYVIETLQILGNQQLPEQRILQEIQSQPGTPFSALTLAQDRAAVIALYENLGYRGVQFDSEVSYPEPGRVRLTYTIQEGQQYFVEQVIVTGNQQTRTSTVEREVAIEAGEPLSLDKILASETNLYNLAVFSRVNVTEIPSYGSDSHKMVLVHLEEAKKYTLLYGIGYDSFEGVRGTFGISNNNFLGMARSLSLGLRAGTRRQRGNLSYTLHRPFNLRLPTVLSLTVANEDRIQTVDDQQRIFRDETGKPFDALRVILSSQSEVEISRRESLFLRYNFERVEIDVPAELELPLQLFREEERLRLSKLAVSYLNDSRDDPLLAGQGFFLNGEALVSGKLLGSEKNFLRFLAQGQYYWHLFPDLVLASSLRIGFIAPFGQTAREPTDNPVPISERFFSGGPTTLRGLPQDLAGPLLTDPKTGEVILVRTRRGDEEGRPVPLGGNALVIANLELRFPLAWIVRGALFYDLGNVFRRFRDAFSHGYSNAVGIGFGLDTPVGPLRFDIGFNPNPPDVPGFKHWNFHFNLGQPF